ncbi:hypothetical protein M378DRAFT_178094 [Amanita muscaria Koide BX008]|uniref:C2H2-type domain-containing protein n=1 Tax=Amanita muscaria (strain Koide BX008) TaxID=946122 RepID=A0A0C2XAL5_AMAMK|nr:hypothetical protein M378DRAFT_178094 [Amanita muscaria Koide BX008]
MSAVSQRHDEQEEWDEDEEDYDEDEDIDAEAEAIARRLGAELWADIRKAKAGSASNATISQATSPNSQHGPGLQPATHTTTLRKEDEALNTVKGILKFASTDPLLHTVLSSSLVKPGKETVLVALERMASIGTIPKDLAMPLSVALVELAKSETLFGCLRLSDAPAVQLANGKRKRDGSDDDRQQQSDARPHKRSYMDTDLRSRVEEAVRIIAQTLGCTPAKTIDPSIISSIRLQLHQVFLFAVTSSAGGGHGMHALQEVGGLIQVIGVLSGIQIGQPSENIEGHPYGANPSYPWFQGQAPPSTTNIGTAVYPCLVAGCGKNFSRLYSLRGHQRLHSVHRPFRCNVCPASFARSHDLKRHLKLHSNKAWKCAGCSKVFSRRDAIKRHKDGCKARGPKGEACINAEVLEVELDEEGDETLREERRAKIWSGITVNQISGTSSTPNQDEFEEGEIPSSVISSAQSTVLSLHAILQTQVESALGTSAGQSTSPPVDVTAGQATLASVIARAQSQTLPKKIPSEAIGVCASSQPATPDQSSGHVVQPEPGGSRAGGESPEPPPFSMFGLSDEQTRLLEEAIANAALAAQAQAEAEAALEEQEQEEADEDYDDEDEDGYYSKKPAAG